MNLTLNGAHRSDNNLIRIQSAQLAENYLVEFEEMFVDPLRELAEDRAGGSTAAGAGGDARGELPQAQHAFDIFYSPRAIAAVDLTSRFLVTQHRLAMESARNVA